MSNMATERNSTLKVNKWLVFSLNPRTEQEIIKAFMEDRNELCISYICKYSKLSEAFIETLGVLSTEKITHYNEDDVNALIDCMYGDKKDAILYCQSEIPKIYHKSQLHDKLDWFYISRYQKLSEKFILRHAKSVDWKAIYKFQDISDKFMKDNLDRLPAPEREVVIN